MELKDVKVVATARIPLALRYELLTLAVAKDTKLELVYAEALEEYAKNHEKEAQAFRAAEAAKTPPVVVGHTT